MIARRADVEHMQKQAILFDCRDNACEAILFDCRDNACRHNEANCGKVRLRCVSVRRIGLVYPQAGWPDAISSGVGGKESFYYWICPTLG